MEYIFKMMKNNKIKYIFIIDFIFFLQEEDESESDATDTGTQLPNQNTELDDGKNRSSVGASSKIFPPP